MPTVKITLDAKEYEAALQSAVSSTRQAAGDMAGALGTASAGAAGLSDATTRAADETQQAMQGIASSADAAAGSLNNLPDTNINVDSNAADAAKETKQQLDAIKDKEVAVKVKPQSSDGGKPGRDVPPNPSKPGKDVADLNDKMKQSAEQISKAGGAVSGFAGALGGVSPQLGLVGQGISALVSGPIGLLTAAFGALVALGMSVWDKLTLSAAEYAAKMDIIAAKSAKARAELEQTQSTEKQYLDRLGELSSAEKLNSDVKAETAKLLDVLTQKYGDLGAEIDATSGRVTNFAEVAARANQKRQDAMAAKLAQEKKDLEKLRSAYFVDYQSSKWQYEEPVARKMDKTLTSVPLQEQLAQMRSGFDRATSKDEIDFYAKQIDFLEQIIDREKKLVTLRNSGETTPEAAGAVTQKKAAARDAAQQTLTDRKNQFAQRKADDVFGTEKSSGRKIANRQTLITAELEKQRDLEKQIAAARDRAANAKDENARLDAVKDILVLQTEQQKSQEKIYGWQQDIAAVARAEAEAVKKLTDAGADELAYQQAILNKQYEKAEALKLEQELKAQNLKLTEDEKKTILAQREAQKAMNLKKGMQDKAVGLYDQALRQSGFRKEADQAKALRDAEQQKGSKLTEAEEQMVLKLADLTERLNNPDKPSLGDTEIKTNALTARGGFAGGVVMPDKDQINREIAAYSKEQLALVREIRDTCEKMETI